VTQPLSRSPLEVVQRVVYQLLSGDAEMIELAPGGLGGSAAWFDEVPEGQTHPYGTLGDMLSTEDNDHGSFGRTITLTLHVWSKTRGNQQGQRIAERAGELLDHQPDALTALMAGSGHRCVSSRQEFDQSMGDPDPDIRHHVQRYRIVTAQIEG